MLAICTLSSQSGPDIDFWVWLRS